MGGVLLCLFTVPTRVDAALFACTDTTGVTIITDRPTQLSQCRSLRGGQDDTESESLSSQRQLSIEPRLTLPAAASGTSDIPQATPPASGAMLSAPLERMGSLFVVSILINETRPARLILDTGASHTILSRAIARDLGLWSQQPSTSVSMQTVGGTVQADLMQIDSIRIAGAEVRHSLVAIHDLPDMPADIEGLLGLSVLRHFEVTLDAPRNRLLLGTVRP